MYKRYAKNITLFESNPKNFRVIFQFWLKFPFLKFLGLISKILMFPYVKK